MYSFRWGLCYRDRNMVQVCSYLYMFQDFGKKVSTMTKNSDASPSFQDIIAQQLIIVGIEQGLGPLHLDIKVFHEKKHEHSFHLL